MKILVTYIIPNKNKKFQDSIDLAHHHKFELISGPAWRFLAGASVDPLTVCWCFTFATKHSFASLGPRSHLDANPTVKLGLRWKRSGTRPAVTKIIHQMLTPNLVMSHKLTIILFFGDLLFLEIWIVLAYRNSGNTLYITKYGKGGILFVQHI